VTARGRWAAALALTAALAGCSSSAAPDDANRDAPPLIDADRRDGPPTDATLVDGPRVDAALTDARGTDATDAAATDAAATDATLVDATAIDAPVVVAPDLDGRITINEFMASNALTAFTPGGVASDWLELSNPTAQDIPLAGYGVTDDLALPRKSVLPAGVTIPAHGRLLLWADSTPSLGATHLGFALADAGGDLALARPDGSYIDRVRYGAQEVDLSAAREPDGSDAWRVVWLASPGAANPAGPGAPMGFEDVALPPEAVPAAGDLSDLILGYDVIPAFGLTVTAAVAAALEADPFTWQPAQLVYQGRSYGPVGLRLKGNNSFEPFSQKPSLKVALDKYTSRARFFGLKDLTFNNMDNDLSMMHERLAYLVARNAGIPASRANHALLAVNGTFYGLYTNVESVKKRMLARWFTDTSAPLFEATDVDFVAADVPRYALEQGPDDRSMLTGAAAALTLADPAQALAQASAFIDLAQFRRFWAMCSVIGQFDSFPYSAPGDDYFVYADPIRKLTFLPWGMDETFYSASVDVTVTHSVLAARCHQSPACFQAYADQVWELVAMIEAMGLDAKRARVAAQIAGYVALDQRKPYTTAEVQASQAAMHWFIVERRADLATMLPPATP